MKIGFILFLLHFLILGLPVWQLPCCPSQLAAGRKVILELGFRGRSGAAEPALQMPEIWAASPGDEQSCSTKSMFQGTL